MNQVNGGKIGVIGIITILVLLWGTILSHAQSPNLVQNGGFENNLTNWEWFVANNADTNYSFTTVAPHSGTKSIALSYRGGSAANTYGLLKQTITGLTVGNTYCVTLWCKGSGVGNNEQVAAGTDWQFRTTLPSGTYGWTSVYLTLVADATSVPLVILTQDATTQLQIDDVTLSSPAINSVSVPSSVRGQTKTVPSGIGINCHKTPSATELQLMREAGITIIRTDLNWNWIEQNAIQLTKYAFQGTYQGTSFNYDALVNSAANYGIRVCFILDYANPLYDGGVSPYTTAGRNAFRNFALAAVNRYKDRGVIWEIYNEPNNFWTFASGTPANASDSAITASIAALYAPLATTVASAIKVPYPNEVVIAPGMGWFDSGAVSRFDNTMDFLKTCMQQGLCQNVDGISVHPYRDLPEPSTGNYTLLWNTIINSSSNTTGKFPAIVSSEWGYSSSWYMPPKGNKSYTQAEKTKAVYLCRSILSNIANKVNLSIIYDWMNDGTTLTYDEHNFGMIANINANSPAISPLNAYYAIKTINTQLGGYNYSGRINTGDGSDYILCFKSGNKTRYVCWNQFGRSHSVTIPAPANTGITDTGYDGTWAGNFRSGATGGFYCTLTDSPQYVVADGQ